MDSLPLPVTPAALGAAPLPLGAAAGTAVCMRDLWTGAAPQAGANGARSRARRDGLHALG
jgi:hypothetical protein